MIQRIQTVYLASGVFLLTGWLFVIVPGAFTESQFDWFVPALYAVAGLSIASGVLAIALYKDKRYTKSLLPGLKRQRKVVVLVQLITLLLAVILYSGLFFGSGLPAITDVMGLVTLAGPALAYLLFFLARRGIDRDITELKKTNDFRLRD